MRVTNVGFVGSVASTTYTPLPLLPTYTYGHAQDTTPEGHGRVRVAHLHVHDHGTHFPRQGRRGRENPRRHYRGLADHRGCLHLADELRGTLDYDYLKASNRPSKSPLRSGTMHVATPDAHPTQPWLEGAEEAWAQRVNVSQSLLLRAYPVGAAPAVVRAVVNEISELMVALALRGFA